jgi:hypothetical protein
MIEERLIRAGDLWQVKAAAIARSRFGERLSLDAGQ